MYVTVGTPHLTAGLWHLENHGDQVIGRRGRKKRTCR